MTNLMKNLIDIDKLIDNLRSDNAALKAEVSELRDSRKTFLDDRDAYIKRHRASIDSLADSLAAYKAVAARLAEALKLYMASEVKAYLDNGGCPYDCKGLDCHTCIHPKCEAVARPALADYEQMQGKEEGK